MFLLLRVCCCFFVLTHVLLCVFVALLRAQPVAKVTASGLPLRW